MMNNLPSRSPTLFRLRIGVLPAISLLVSAAISATLAHKSATYFSQNFLFYWFPQLLAIWTIGSQTKQRAVASGASIAFLCLLVLCGLIFHHGDDWLIYIFATGGAVGGVLILTHLNFSQLSNAIWGFILGFLAATLGIAFILLLIWGPSLSSRQLWVR